MTLKWIMVVDLLTYFYYVTGAETFRLVTDDKGKKDDTLDAFLKALPRSKCRYAIYDQQFKNGEGRIIEKLFYIVWTPGAAQSREKVCCGTAIDCVHFLPFEFFVGFLPTTDLVLIAEIRNNR